MPQSPLKTVCNISNDITPMEQKNKWFMNFYISLLNDSSYNYIINKSYKSKERFQDELAYTLKVNKLDEFFSNSGIKFYLSNTINKTIIGHKKNTNLFDWIEKNYYINFFIFPYFINFLGFKCVTFEYYEKVLHGGIYNHLKKLNLPNKNYHYVINNNSIEQSNGFDYQYNKNRHPEYLIINLWMANDRLPNLDIEDGTLESISINDYANTKSISSNLLKRDDTYNEILEYNGYKYYLKSFLIENYNFKEYKKQRHTITLIKCGNTQYVYTNSSINKSTAIYSMLLGNKETIPCTKLIQFKGDIYSDLSFSDTECGLFSYRKEDLNTKYCYSLSKGRRVLIYVREEEAEKKKRDDAEKAAQEKKDKEAELAGKVIDKIKDGKKVETDAEKEARIKKENQDRLCKNIFDYVDKIRTKIDKQDIDEKMKKDKEFVMKKLKELEDNEKNYAAHKADLEKTKKDIEKMHKDNLEELKKYIEELKKKRTIIHA